MGCGLPTESKAVQKLSIGTYQVIKQSKIACGAYGSIWLCYSISSGKKYVLKQVGLKADLVEDMYDKEVSFLKLMNKKGYSGAVKIIADDIQKHKRQGQVGRMLLELGSTTLIDEINQKEFTQIESLKILKDISSALKQIHSLGVYHFDIKPENVIQVNGTYKLCDFGSYLEKDVDFDRLDKQQRRDFKQFLEHNTTAIYSPPEILEPKGKIIGEKADIWMLGCIAYILAFGKHPFEEGKSMILKGDLKYPSEGFLTDLIREMFRSEPSTRPTAADIHKRLSDRIKALQ